MPSLEIYLFRKQLPVGFETASWWYHVAVREQLRLSDGLAKRSFHRSNIWRVQLRSNLTVGERLLVADQWTVSKCGLILSKTQWHVFECLVSKFIHFEKNICEWVSWWCQVELRELLRLSRGFVKRCFYRSIILRVQLKSNWTVGKKLLASDKRAVGKFKLILYKGLIYSFQKKAVFQGALSCYAWYSF